MEKVGLIETRENIVSRTFRKNYGSRERVPAEIGEEPSRTKQSFADSVNVNNIIASYSKTGVLKNVPEQPMYGDFTAAPDYLAALNVSARARENFEALPAKVRARFNNDPKQFLEFVGDKENLDEGVKLGLWKKPKEPITKLEKKDQELPPVPGTPPGDKK